MKKDHIYWNEQWNVCTGCSGKGCPTKDTCWAKDMVRRFPHIHDAGEDRPFSPFPHPIPFHKIQFHPDRLDRPMHWRKPRRIGVCFMSDLFDEQVKGHWRADIYDIMAMCPNHQFFILTKQSENMEATLTGNKWIQWGDNVWHGVTITSQADADRMLPELLRIPGKRWISYEPAIGPVDFSDYIWIREVNRNGQTWKHGFDFIVIGSHNRPKLYTCPHEWMIDVVEQCKAAGVPCFVKQMAINGKCCTDITKFPKELQVREWPEL